MQFKTKEQAEECINASLSMVNSHERFFYQRACFIFVNVLVCQNSI